MGRPRLPGAANRDETVRSRHSPRIRGTVARTRRPHATEREMLNAEQRSAEAISRCYARWLEPEEPSAPQCANCDEIIKDERLAYKREPVCSQTCWNELLERDR